MEANTAPIEKAATLAPAPIEELGKVQDEAHDEDADGPDMIEEVLIGLDRLRRMSHTELAEAIESRVAMANSTLLEREEAREAWQTARHADHVLQFRKARTRRFTRYVDFASGMTAAAATAVLFVTLY